MDFLEKKIIEFVWTIGPVFILIILGFPSLNLLYHSSVVSKNLSFNEGNPRIKITGHQWYWRYEYKSDAVKTVLSYDSYIDPNGLYFRNLEVDKPLVIKAMKLSNLLVTSEDVLHSFALPGLGIKVDAVPGRIKELLSLPFKVGVFFGQCSELCGVNHRFMPIEVEIVC